MAGALHTARSSASPSRSARRRTRTGRAVAVLLAAAAVATSCATEAGGGAGSAPSFVDLLASLPERDGRDELVQVVASDLLRAGEAIGLERPDPTDLDAVGAFIRAVSGVPVGGGPAEVQALLPSVGGFSSGLPRGADIVDELGWSFGHVAWFAERVTPPDPVAVLGLDVDAQQLTDAMGEPDDEGIWSLGGEEGSVDLSGRTPARPLGEALRMRFDGDRLTVARSMATMDAALGGARSLADDSHLRSLGRALDDEEAYTAMLLSGPSFAIGPVGARSGSDPGSDLAGRVLPERFEALAVGAGHDGEPYVLLVYAHLSDAAASANERALVELLAEGESLANRQPWSERAVVDEVRTDGTTLIARLRLPDGVSVGWVFSAAVARDGIVAHR